MKWNGISNKRPMDGLFVLRKHDDRFQKIWIIEMESSLGNKICMMIRGCLQWNIFRKQETSCRNTENVEIHILDRTVIQSTILTGCAPCLNMTLLYVKEE